MVPAPTMGRFLFRLMPCQRRLAEIAARSRGLGRLVQHTWIAHQPLGVIGGFAIARDLASEPDRSPCNKLLVEWGPQILGPLRRQTGYFIIAQ